MLAQLAQLALLASVTSKCGDRQVHGVIEEFRQNQGWVWQCRLFVHSRSLPRRLRVRFFIKVRRHFALFCPRLNSTSTALLSCGACAEDTTQMAK